MRFLDVWACFNKKELTIEQATALLGVPRSTFYRMRCRYADEGEEGPIDHMVGKALAKTDSRCPPDGALSDLSIRCVMLAGL